MADKKEIMMADKKEIMMADKIAKELVGMAKKVVAKPRRSLLSVHLKKQIQEFVDSDEKNMRTKFGGQFKDASFSVRKTPNGSLVITASWHGKSDFGASYKDGVQEYKLRAGYSDKSLDNMAARAVNFVLETKNRWYHINKLHNAVEKELSDEQKVQFEDFVASKGIQVMYADMTADEAIEVLRLLETEAKRVLTASDVKNGKVKASMTIDFVYDEMGSRLLFPGDLDYNKYD